MGPEKRICRLCLQIIGEDVPYSSLTNNAKALRNLEHISINTVKNLALTAEPLICKLCDNTLKELSDFKETAIANESKIQSDSFLSNLSEDVEAVCRVCLKPSENKDELQKSWKDHEELLSQCNIQLNENISVPAKICNACNETLQKTTDFISLCSKNERLIEDLAVEKEKLTADDLIVASSKISSDVESKTENYNNKLRSAGDNVNIPPKNKQPSKPKKNSAVGKTRNKKQEPSSNSAKVTKRSSAKKNSITNYMIKNSNDGNPQEETSHVTKKTNKTKKNTLKKLHPLELPSTSKAGLPTQDSLERELMLRHVNEQMEQMHISIDAIPISNLSDITLDVGEGGLVQGEATNECNVTQELINVLEGTLNDKEPYAIQGSSNGLKAELVYNGGVECSSSANEMSTLDLESNSRKVKNLAVDHDISDLDVNKSTVRTYTKTSKNSRVPKKITPEANEVLQPPISIKEEILPNIKQKTIVTSFQEIRNLKLMKNKESADQNMHLAPAEKSGEIINEQDNSSIVSTKEINSVVKKANNKMKEKSNDSGPPKKRMKKTVDEPPEPVKSNNKSPVEVIRLPPNEASVAPKGNTDYSSDDDEFIEESSDKIENRPVTVTIIKGKKRTKKAQLDKTWQELTGKPTHSRTNANTGPAGLEIAPVKRRRGRPPLPSHLKKEKTKNPIVWMHCEQCPFKTYAQNSFLQHQLIHNVMSTIPTLHCDICRFTTSNSELMQQHKATHESTHLIYKCVFCDEIFKKKISCMYHTLRHDDQDVASQFYCLVYNGVTEEEHFECYQCDYQNAEESIMPDHVIDHSIQRPKNPLLAKFKCDLCEYRTKSEDLLKRHKSLHDAKTKSPKKSSQTEVKSEIKTEPDADIDESLPPFLKCDQCHYMTRNKRSMANHKGLKHNRKIHPIVQGKAAATKAEENDSPMFYCNECSYSTHRKLNLPRHALVHRTKENMEFFECPHCLFETKHRRSYTRHMEAIHAVIV